MDISDISDWSIGTDALENNLATSYKAEQARALLFRGSASRICCPRASGDSCKNVHSSLLCHNEKTEQIKLAEWSNKLWYISVMENYTSGKINELQQNINLDKY